MKSKSLWLIISLITTNVSAIEQFGDKTAKFAQAIKQNTLMAGVELLRVERNVERVIAPTDELKSGERFRLRLSASVDSHYRLETLNTGVEAKTEPVILQGQIKAGQTLVLPAQPQNVFELDDNPGTEWLQLTLARQNNKKVLKSRSHPQGKIQQIILRGVDLLSSPSHQVDYDAASKVIYVYLKEPAQGNEISLQLGLNHQK